MFLQKKNTTKAHLQKNEARVFFYTKIKMEQKKNTLLQQKTNSNTEKNTVLMILATCFVIITNWEISDHSAWICLREINK